MNFPTDHVLPEMGYVLVLLLKSAPTVQYVRPDMHHPGVSLSSMLEYGYQAEISIARNVTVTINHVSDLLIPFRRVQSELLTDGFVDSSDAAYVVPHKRLQVQFLTKSLEFTKDRAFELGILAKGGKSDSGSGNMLQNRVAGVVVPTRIEAKRNDRKISMLNVVPKSLQESIPEILIILGPPTLLNGCAGRGLLPPYGAEVVRDLIEVESAGGKQIDKPTVEPLKVFDQDFPRTIRKHRVPKRRAKKVMLELLEVLHDKIELFLDGHGSNELLSDESDGMVFLRRDLEERIFVEEWLREPISHGGSRVQSVRE